jgi:murein L,D-transpeptidase YafK
LSRRPLVRSLLASAALAATLALAGCETDGPAPSLRSLQPLSAQMLNEIEQKNMSKESPILVRLFKEESELEVWKQDKDGRFALLKTYPICRWSGELGPKIKEGDRQAPEGFYTITPGLMNPNSSYYLAINTGFPNAYDRANGRTGAFLMIHGDCSSRGCYAMTDEQIAEIYALARESFFGGQRSFQLQAYPFRMTPLNMAKHRNSPHMAFWKMLKQGNDHFEVTRQEPKVDVCEKRYVFDAQASGKFTPAGACPAYKVPEEVASAVAEKQRQDDRQFAELANRTPTVAVRTGTDGGMHPTFQAAFQTPYTDAAGIIRSAKVSLPGTIPAHAVPPGPRDATGSVKSTTPATQVAAAQSSSSGSMFGSLFSSSGSSDSQSSSGGVLNRMSRLMGLGGSEPAEQAAAPAKPKTVAAKQSAPAKPKAQAEAQPARTANAGAISAQAKAPATQEANADPQAARPANNASLLNGAQPTVPAGTFDNRWGAFR